MSLPGREILRVAVVLGASHLLSVSLLAQAATNHPALTLSNSTLPRPLVTKPPAPPPPGPPLPFARSPISFFRELLAMNPAERIQALTNRTPELRTQILAKVREYESLKPDERELRLRVTELRWYLRPLMTAPATNRAAQLAMIPEPDRELVEDRLQEWDKLPPDVQKELLGIEPTLRYLAEIEGRSDVQRRQLAQEHPPGAPHTAGKRHPEVGFDARRPAPEDVAPVQPVLRTDRGGKGESAQDALRAGAAAD